MRVGDNRLVRLTLSRHDVDMLLMLSSGGVNNMRC